MNNPEKLEEKQLNISNLTWQPNYPKEFDNLKFKVEPGFHPSTLYNGEIIDTRYTYQKTTIEGFEYSIAGRDDALKNNEHISRSINLYIGREENYVNATIEISEYEERIIAETSIVRHDSQKKLLRGLGRIFANETIKFLQELVIKSGKPVTHRVDKNPGYDGVDLSESEWDRMFIPKLIEGGYSQDTDTSFSKTYYPKNQ